MNLLFDFSRVLLMPKDPSIASLNGLYREHKDDPDFNFFNYFELNEELLSYLAGIKDKANLYIFTSESIQDAPEVAPRVSDIFTKVYSALTVGYGKKDPNSYLWIACDLGVEAAELVFVDDALENIEAAKQAGLRTIHFVSNEELIDKLNNL